MQIAFEQRIYKHETECNVSWWSRCKVDVANSNTTTIWSLDTYIDLSGMWLGLDLRTDSGPCLFRRIWTTCSTKVNHSRIKNQYEQGDLYWSLRAGLDYGEEVHWSRTLRERSNIIGYKMGCSLVGVYTTAKTSPVENFKHENNEKMTWLPIGQHFLLGEFSRGQVSWATSNPWTRNSTLENSNFRQNKIVVFSSCPSYQLLNGRCTPSP